MRPVVWAALCTACTSDLVHDRLDVRSDGAVIPVAVHGYVDSGTLVVVESGGPSGPGIAERAVGYMPFQDTLEPHVGVAWYDRRGTGNATGDYGVDDQSMGQLIVDLDAVLAVLDERYQPERLVVLSHSFGTYTSAIYLIDHPGRVDGWVASAPALFDSPDDLYVPYRRAFACRVAADRIDRGSPAALWPEIVSFCEANPVIELFSADGEMTPEGALLWDYLGRIEDRLEPWPPMDAAGLLGAVFASLYNVVDTQARPNLISSHIEPDPGREDPLPELGNIEVPVAVVTGELDGTSPTELGDAIVGALGGPATLTEIRGGGHYMMADDPEAFAAAVLALTDQL